MASGVDSARRWCRADLGVDGDGRGWPIGEVLVRCAIAPASARYELAVAGAALAGDALTGFLAQVSPFGCPPPPSLIRAFSLPDAPFPSILLREHAEGPAGLGEAYRRFADGPRRHWLGALQETGPGLRPVLAWQTRPVRRFLRPDAEGEPPLAAAVADDYLGRGVLLLANPDLAASWQTMMSLGGPTKVRKITGREFPVWVDLPVHQPALLSSPLLARIEELLADGGRPGA